MYEYILYEFCKFICMIRLEKWVGFYFYFIFYMFSYMICLFVVYQLIVFKNESYKVRRPDEVRTNKKMYGKNIL